MSGSMALWGGFTSFFSVWQICILQFSPFFITFIVGIYLATLGQKTDPGILRWIVPPCIAYAVVFTIFYSLLIASGLDISRPLIRNVGSLRIVSGILILLVSLYILLVNRTPFLGRMHRPPLLIGLSLLVGFSFAIMYSPCITPMLSDIMALASQRNTSAEGWYLAFCYGLGISIAMGMVSVALIMFLGKREIVLRNAGLLKNICGITLLALAFMNMAGLMRHYKAFVLGFAF